MSPESLLGEATGPIVTAGTGLMEQVGRVIITDDNVLASAGDLAKVISVQLKKSGEARLALTKPLKDHCKWIESQFKEKENPLNEAKAGLKVKMDDYVSERHERQEKEAEEARQKAEKESLERAAEAEAAGDTDTAEAIVDAAAELPETVTKAPIARGGLGSSTSTKTTWLGEVVDIKAFLQAIIDGDIPEDYIEVKQSKLNALAVRHKIEKTNLGIRVYKKISAITR